MYSVVIPVYKNAEFVPQLIAEFTKINDAAQERYGIPVEFVFVDDYSPDASHELLARALPNAPFRSQLVLHARNFGSFAAIRTGLKAATGDYFGVVAADLQEPPEILLSFLQVLATDECDIAVGVREERNDPAASRAAATLFWRLYRRVVMKEIPEGGVDIFACNRRVRDELLKLEESHSSLVGLIFWLGFRRAQIGYTRRPRMHGKSAWTFSKKLTYLLDSIFAFTDLPVRILTFLGALGTGFALIFAMVILVLRLIGGIPVPGYAATIVAIMFFGALNTFGLGLVGSYAWRGYENSKRRPLSVVQSIKTFAGLTPADPLGTKVPSMMARGK
jgi:polyisoprenyl-phosphate glycosyltransferase